MSHSELYQIHLDRVSRSFALCISRLEDPLRKWVGLTYLLCRVLDTVEDAIWDQDDLQKKSFLKFDEFISSPSTMADVSVWAKRIPQDIPEGERLLIQDLQVLLEDLHEAPMNIKKPIQDLIRTMSSGMREFAEQKTKGAMRLRGLSEVNRYCFFVAGIVGETLSKLLSAVDAKVRFTRPLVVDAHHFGLFLQKVNLLKDQIGDEREGRFLVPSREETFLSLKENAEGAMRYIEALPLEQVAYRVFCLWSLFLGLRTLPILKLQDSELSQNKIPREEILMVFKQIETYATDSVLIRETFNELMAQVFDQERYDSHHIPIQNSNSHEVWSPKFYLGLLQSEDFKALNMAK